MPCYKPVDCYHKVGGGVTWKKAESNGRKAQIPCQQCIGCRLERSRQWAVRMMHEASLHEDNTFITLTYDDDNLPYGGSLDLRHYQLFMKRLRKKYSDRTIRFFHCGEYGDRFERPHYHAVLFGFDFPDKELFRTEHGGASYTSEILTNLWDRGHCLIGDVTFESCAYVARYVTKKITGADSELHYERADEYGVVVGKVRPEYATMSRRPGIGQDWFRRYGADVYPFDEVVVNGHPTKPPRYYDDLLKKDREGDHEKVKLRRKQLAWKHRADSTPERLAARERVIKARTSELHRRYENGTTGI
jgi:hypothetical protein